MSLGESTNSRSFEVRCARCDVTFPVGTKRCIHCGVPIGPGHAVSLSDTRFGTSATPYDSADVGSFETKYGMGGEQSVFRDEPGNASTGVGAAPASASAPASADAEDAGSSPVKALIRSMGGVIWILLLVGFSLARSCGGG